MLNVILSKNFKIFPENLFIHVVLDFESQVLISFTLLYYEFWAREFLFEIGI